MNKHDQLRCSYCNLMIYSKKKIRRADGVYHMTCYYRHKIDLETYDYRRVDYEASEISENNFISLNANNI